MERSARGWSRGRGGGRQSHARRRWRADTGDVTLQRDLEPVLADLSDLSNLPEEEARRRAREILDRLEDFQPSAASLSGVMELAMADGVAPKAGEELENSTQSDECREKVPAKCPVHGLHDETVFYSKCGWAENQIIAARNAISEQYERLRDSQYNGTISLGTVSGRLVDDVRALDADIDLSGYGIDLTAHAARHMQKRHGQGKEQKENQSGLLKDDFLMIPDIISSYDFVRLANSNKDRKAISFVKIANGSELVLIGAEYSARKKLLIKTMWKVKLEQK